MHFANRISIRSHLVCEQLALLRNFNVFRLQGHIVMYNSRDYANFSEAYKNVNGLAVVGVFFEHDDSGTPNPTLESITKAIDQPNILQCNCTSKGEISKKYSILHIKRKDSARDRIIVCVVLEPEAYRPLSPVVYAAIRGKTMVQRV